MSDLAKDLFANACSLNASMAKAMSSAKRGPMTDAHGKHDLQGDEMKPENAAAPLDGGLKLKRELTAEENRRIHEALIASGEPAYEIRPPHHPLDTQSAPPCASDDVAQWNAAIEAAAKVADSTRDLFGSTGNVSFANEANNISCQIRALKKVTADHSLRKGPK